MTLEPLNKTADYNTKIGAEILAHRIRRVWAQRGAEPTIYVTKRHGAGRLSDLTYDVRSNMVGGRP